jgi:hypothetical protein
MIPIWFPWIFVGGLIFIALSFIATKYKDKQYRSIQYLQDFISGAILIGFIGVLVPDMFPKFDFNIPIPIQMSGGSTDMGSDFDLQVGPPRLAGR